MKITVGQMHGRLLVTAIDGKNATVQCRCGVVKSMPVSLLKEDRKTCGSAKCHRAWLDDIDDQKCAELIGRRYGSLVITKATRRAKNGGSRKVEFRCDCGKKIESRIDDVERLRNQDCGCGTVYVDPMWKLALYTAWPV